MEEDFNKILCSGVRSLDKLRFKAAGSRAGSISVSIEELNAIRTEIESNACKNCGNELQKYCPNCFNSGSGNKT